MRPHSCLVYSRPIAAPYSGVAATRSGLTPGLVSTHRCIRESDGQSCGWPALANRNSPRYSDMVCHCHHNSIGGGVAQVGQPREPQPSRSTRPHARGSRVHRRRVGRRRRRSQRSRKKSTTISQPGVCGYPQAPVGKPVRRRNSYRVRNPMPPGWEVEHDALSQAECACQGCAPGGRPRRDNASAIRHGSTMVPTALESGPGLGLQHPQDLTLTLADPLWAIELSPNDVQGRHQPHPAVVTHSGDTGLVMQSRPCGGTANS